MKNNKLEEAADKIKTLQQQLASLEKLAALGKLTAGITHEIKNPLNFVNNFAWLCEKQIGKMNELLAPLQDRFDSEERKALNQMITTIDANLKKIRQYGTQANSIIKNMLEFSREEANVHFQSIDINELLNEDLKLVYHAKRAEDTSLNVQMETEFEDHGEIIAFPQDIKRMVLNLLDNAFYAVSTKKKALGESYLPVVKITTKSTGKDKVSISFYDNGTGMPPRVIKKLFTPFFTTKPPGEGTGLGLSLCREIAVAHHGEIQVESKAGEFTRFTIILPRKQPLMEGSDEKNIAR